jgi:hypothetical protein
MFSRINTHYHLLTIIFISFSIFSCSKSPTSDIEGKTWVGNLYNNNDIKLSKVLLKVSNDSMFIYSNAIFGADMDTLKLTPNTKDLSTLTYENNIGENITIEIKRNISEKNEYLILKGNDFYIKLTPTQTPINKKSLEFYSNTKVPRKAYMYLQGAYEGYLEMENKMHDVFLSSSMGHIKLKYLFLDNFQVKTSLKSIFGNDTKVYPYKYNGEKIVIIERPEKDDNPEFTILEKGNKLVYQSEKMNIILHKIY